jgi:Pvc16 N-terminal domain
MALPDSSLYLACQAVVDTLTAGIQANTHNIKTYIGAPADLSSKTDEIRLNLFFYRFEPSGFQAGAHPNDPWRIRAFVLLTCMAASGDDQGVEDLRLLGMVMSYFNENRIMPLLNIGAETVRLQAVFTPTTDEQINQIWSTQGDTTYRPSVIYEISLAPVMPSVLRGQPPRVGFTGLETGADMNRRFDPFAGSVRTPGMSVNAVNSANPAWTPIVCWVDAGECKTSLVIDVDVVDPTTVTPVLWVAGKSGANVSLEWQVWQEEEWQQISGGNLVISSTAIEPSNIPVGLPTITLPVVTLVGQKRWQFLLYVTRSYQPFAGAEALTLRSNPVLMSLHRGSTP